MGHSLAEMLHPEPIFTEKKIEYIHIMRSKGNWGVYKSKGKRSLKNFKHRDLAFYYAAENFKFQKIIVHKKNGDIAFTY